MTYGELAEVLADLPALIRHQRRRKGLSIRAAAAEAGIQFTTLSRWERGVSLPTDTVLKVLAWLDTTPSPKRARR